MAVIVGSQSLVGMEVDASTRAARTTVFPQAVDGVYRISARTGNMATVAAAAEIFAFRWSSATKLCLVRRLQISAVTSVGFTASQQIAAQATLATGFTVAGSGGTSIGATKLRQSHAASVVDDVRIASTVGLTAGTRTATNPIARGQGIVPATNLATIFDYIAEWKDAQSYPIVLAQNEGLLASNVVLGGAGGSIVFQVEIEWAEVVNANFPI